MLIKNLFNLCFFQKLSTNFAKIFKTSHLLPFFNNMSLMTNPSKKEENLRYSEQELKEFEEIINTKLTNARAELAYLKASLSGKASEGIDGSVGNAKLMEDVADVTEKESLNQLAARQQKFIHQLELALIRIKNGTYGVCIDTGKLIAKERLRAVPHTQQSVEAKKARM